MQPAAIEQASVQNLTTLCGDVPCEIRQYRLARLAAQLTGKLGLIEQLENAACKRVDIPVLYCPTSLPVVDARRRSTKTDSRARGRHIVKEFLWDTVRIHPRIHGDSALGEEPRMFGKWRVAKIYTTAYSEVSRQFFVGLERRLSDEQQSYMVSVFDNLAERSEQMLDRKSVV